MKRTMLSILVSVLVGCGGSGPEPIPVKVTVDDPNAPAKSSSDLTSGKHLDLSPPPLSVTNPTPSIREVPTTAQVDTVQQATSEPVSQTQSQPQPTQQTQVSGLDPSQDPNYVNEYEVHCDANNVCTRKSKTPAPPPGTTGMSKSKMYCDAGAQPGGVLPADCPIKYVPI